MILGTYDPTTMTRKDLYHKIFVAKEPEEGEQPRVSKKGQELLGKSLTDTMPSKPPKPAPATARTSDAIFSPTLAESRTSMPTEETVKYYTMFEQASKAEKWTITLQEVLEHTKSFDQPADIVREIWETSDTNRDQRWDIEELANAMH